MTRSRASAKAAGAKHERVIADYFEKHLSRFIDKMPKYGANDRGDIANVETFNEGRIAVECKDYGGQLKVGPWLDEAEVERINLKGVAGVVIAKRRGISDPGKQTVLMTVDDFIAITSGKRPEKEAIS